MRSPGFRLFRIKPTCLVDGASWLTAGGLYRGSTGTGEVRTVHLVGPDGGETLEVLRGSVVEVTDPAHWPLTAPHDGD